MVHFIHIEDIKIYISDIDKVGFSYGRHSSTSCPMTLPLKVFVHLVPFSIRETYTLPELLSKGVSYISSQRQGISIPKPTESLKN